MQLSAGKRQHKEMGPTLSSTIIYCHKVACVLVCMMTRVPFLQAEHPPLKHIMRSLHVAHDYMLLRVQAA